MKIDKNNYEAFLLDYIEGNLSAEMTAELMLFLQQNPEIETGIEDFKIISLKKEDASFDSKNELKRKEFVVNDDLIEGLIISFVNGDLSKAEEKKLLTIVSENPEYKKLLEQYQSTRLQHNDEKLSDKVLLKSHLPVTADNAEYFVIAEMEGVLSNDKKKSLDAYRSEFPGIKKLSVVYAGTKLDTEEKFVFDNKSSLKKKEAVVISFYSVMKYSTVAAAACLILYFGFFASRGDSRIAHEAKMKIQEINPENQNLIADETNPKEEINEIAIPEKNEEIIPQKLHNSTNPIAFEKKKNDSPIEKEPMIDGGLADDEIHEKQNQNDAPVLYAREELKVITNEDQNTLANANTSVSSLNEDDFITPGQYVRNWAKKTFFTEVAQAEHETGNQNTGLADNSTLKLKGTNATVSNKESKEYKEYGFSIGKFSFQRKVRK